MASLTLSVDLVVLLCVLPVSVSNRSLRYWKNVIHMQLETYLDKAQFFAALAVKEAPQRLSCFRVTTILE